MNGTASAFRDVTGGVLLATAVVSRSRSTQLILMELTGAPDPPGAAAIEDVVRSVLRSLPVTRYPLRFGRPTKSGVSAAEPHI